MVDIGSETRAARLAALVERAQIVFERSHHLVEKARKIRTEAEAKCLVNSAQSRKNYANVAFLNIDHAAD